MSDARFLVGSASDVGRVRSMNEDSFVVTDQVFAVADGMGGHLAGEVASAMAAGSLRRLKGPATTDDAVNAVIAANMSILELSRNDASHRGMGTTLTGIALVHNSGESRLAVINVGDSRTYRLRAGRLEQISIDHSYVQELVNAGHISVAEARVHPQRNIVTRALGIEAGVGIDVWSLPLVRGDRYLSCSDGLVDEVLDEDITDVLCGFADPQAAAAELVRLANQHGGRDNTTVVVVDVLRGVEPGAVDDSEDVITYITVRGTEPDDTTDDTMDEAADVTFDPSDDEPVTHTGHVVRADRAADLGITLAQPIVSAAHADDTPPYEANPPADLTAAVLSHGRDPSGHYPYPVAHADETPNTTARRLAMRARSNMRFIIGGVAVALIAIILVIVAAATGGKSKDAPIPTDTVAITDPVSASADAAAGSVSDTISDTSFDSSTDTVPNTGN